MFLYYLLGPTAEATVFIQLPSLPSGWQGSQMHLQSFVLSRTPVDPRPRCLLSATPPDLCPALSKNCYRQKALSGVPMLATEGAKCDQGHYPESPCLIPGLCLASGASTLEI